MTSESPRDQGRRNNAEVFAFPQHLRPSRTVVTVSIVTRILLLIAVVVGDPVWMRTGTAETTTTTAFVYLSTNGHNTGLVSPVRCADPGRWVLPLTSLSHSSPPPSTVVCNCGFTFRTHSIISAPFFGESMINTSLYIVKRAFTHHQLMGGRS